MRNTTRKLATAAVSLGAAVSLAACGAGTASHVVQGSSPAATTPVSTPAGTGPAATTPAVTTPAVPGASSAISTQTLNQIDAELGALDASLSQANADLTDPQGDS